MDNKLEKYGLIYNWLQDDISREIYVNRMFYAETGERKFIRNIVEKSGALEPEFIFRDEYVKLIGKKVVIYGTGSDAEVYYERLTQWNQTNIVGFCDGKAEQGEFEFHGKRVMTPEKAAEITDAFFLIGSSLYKGEMIQKLLDCGVAQERIIIFEGCFFIRNYPGQYFDPDIMKFSDNEVFIDCGPAMGGENLQLLRKGGKNSCVYMLEPSAENVAVIRAAYGASKACHILPAGAWSKSGKMYFSSGPNRYSGYLSAEETDGPAIDVVAIDDLTIEEGNPVTFIKMDIEGAELEALRGARKTIARDVPKLAICIYHKPEDLIEIPCFIKSIVPQYKLYIRHYSNYDCETVLYAVL